MLMYVLTGIEIVVMTPIAIWAFSGRNNANICPNCHKEYKECEKWSCGDYLWGLRCPHCKYEFDITP